jgi:hypothetical protein
VNNNKIILDLLEEEEEEDQLLFSYLLPNKRKSTNILFKNREFEGFFEILINRHLLENETKFREFFRINYEQFNFILSLVEFELTKEPSNRVKNPISAAEKLAITLRYV